MLTVDAIEIPIIEGEGAGAVHGDASARFEGIAGPGPERRPGRGPCAFGSQQGHHETEYDRLNQPVQGIDMFAFL